MTIKTLLQLILDTLNEMKALEITTMDVRDMTDVTDHMIICSGTSNRHTQSIADKLTTEAKAHGFKPLGTEGQETGEWILVDLGDVVVHIMLPKTREFYNLEKLWNKTTEIRQLSPLKMRKNHDSDSR